MWNTKVKLENNKIRKNKIWQIVFTIIFFGLLLLVVAIGYSAETAHTEMDLLTESQANKTVTINENMQIMDAFVINSISSANTITQPTLSLTAGDLYFVPASATGADWGSTGNQNKLAHYRNSAWSFYTIPIGFPAFIKDTSSPVIFNGTDFISLGSITSVLSVSQTFIADADGDTYARTEETSDEDVFRIGSEGTENVSISTSLGITFKNDAVLFQDITSSTDIFFIGSSGTYTEISNFSIGANAGLTVESKDSLFRVKHDNSDNNLLVLNSNSFESGLSLYSYGNSGNAIPLQITVSELVVNSTEISSGNISSDISILFGLYSTSKGFLPPTMTEAQRDAIASPTRGLQIFNTDLLSIDVYDGVGWFSLAPAGP